MIKKTKIICTLGPAVDDDTLLEKLFLNGMDVARINFSHGTHAQQKERIDRFKRIREKTGLPVALLLDTKGPEIRLGIFETKEVVLKEGDKFVLTTENVKGTQEISSITYKNLYKDVEEDSLIYINDGLVALRVTDIKGEDIHCVVLNGGEIGNNKSINVPNAKIHLPALTPSDIEDIKFGIKNEFDFIAASFIRKASDISEIRRVLEKNNGKDIKIIAKIENREGITNFEEILKVSDGIMVARGDLGVEIPVEEVPIVQKRLIELCYSNGKPVITATQMLDSMIRNPRPTRAETSDIANAIYDGTSGIMLSGETAAGKYPVESLKMMVKITQKTESSNEYWKKFASAKYNMPPSVTNALSHATCTTASDLNAAAILTVTQSGNTARMISRFRPACPIIATTMSPRVQRQLSISWGVIPKVAQEVFTTDDIFDLAIDKALETGLVKSGDLVVITAGVPLGVSGTTNTLKVHIVGKVLIQGQGIGKGCTSGELCVARTAAEAREKFVDGNILVLPFTDNSMLDLLKRAAAVVVEESNIDCHTSTVGLALDIPVIVGAENAVKILKSGVLVNVDADNGNIFYGA